MIDKGCKVFFPTVVVAPKQSPPELAQILVIKDFVDVLMDEVP